MTGNPLFGSVAGGRLRVGIAGAGAIALASAAWLHQAGHGAMLWSPGGKGAQALRTQPLQAGGLHPCAVAVEVAADAETLCRDADVLLIALPVNGHRRVMDALLPWLRDGQTVIVSSMASLSALYLYESARVGLKTGDHMPRGFLHRHDIVHDHAFGRGL